MTAYFFKVLRVCLSWTFCLGLLAALTGQAQQPQVQLLSDRTQIVPGETFTVAVTIDLEPGWHLYWRNPGASGLPLELEWDLPEGLQAGAIEWAPPQRVVVGGLVNYVYKQSATYRIPIRSSESLALGTPLSIRVKAFWLMCKELCLPDEAILETKLVVAAASKASPEAEMIEAAGRQLPARQYPNPLQIVRDDAGAFLVFKQTSPHAQWMTDAYFYPNTSDWIDPNQAQTVSGGGALLQLPLKAGLSLPATIRLQGMLEQGDQYWHLDLSYELPVEGAGSLDSSVDVTPKASGFEQTLLSWGLPGLLILAFMGGLILNAMPCVLPVLSLKVFSLLQHCGQSKRQALGHGLAYTLGVVLSFVLLAALLFLLRSWGEQVGWGFQLQNPSFVVLLALFFFGFGLNMLGVFELGAGWVGADAKLSQRSDWIGSLGMGVLAAVVGAPCMGPLLASVSGVAVQTTVGKGLALFAMMGLGLAAPFLFLSIFPKLVSLLPRPGLWMESLKQFMGFLLLAAVLFLTWVLAEQLGLGAVVAMLVAFWLLAVAAWVYGRWAAPVKSKRSQRLASGLSLFLLACAIWSGLMGAQKKGGDDWEPWSESAVQAALAAGRPVFIDFTASWCVICQVNKRVALRTEATQSLFEAAKVARFEADWTLRDPAISRALEAYGRSGVPLYILQFPGEEPRVLPQNLTQGILQAEFD